LRCRHRGRPLPGAHEVALQLGGSAEAELLATCFAYGRYLLASASRPGLPPATLQGLWHPRLEAPWSSTYTVNTHLEIDHAAARGAVPRRPPTRSRCSCAAPRRPSCWRPASPTAATWWPPPPARAFRRRPCRGCGTRSSRHRGPRTTR